MDLVPSGSLYLKCYTKIDKFSRWVCTSGESEDLETTDKLALEVLKNIVAKGVPTEIEQQYNDNIKWITEASKHKMVVGSQVQMINPNYLQHKE